MLTDPPPHLEHEWQALSEAEREDVLRWALGHGAYLLRHRAEQMTRSITATVPERIATFRAADFLSPPA